MTLLTDLRKNPRLAALRIRGKLARIFHVKRKTVGSVRFHFPEYGGRLVEMMRSYSYENELLACMNQWLGPGDVFVDVGANIGFVAASALSRVGPQGQVHAFEPVPHYYANLALLGKLNPGAPLRHYPIGLSDTAGEVEIAITSDGNIGWNTMVPGFMPPSMIGEMVRVKVSTLDDQMGQTVVKMVKIDVEGYEYKVLNGMNAVAAHSQPIIYLEYAPSGNAKMGVTAGDFEKWIGRHGYRALDPGSGEPVRFAEMDGTRNVLLIPRVRQGIR